VHRPVFPENVSAQIMLSEIVPRYISWQKVTSMMFPHSSERTELLEPPGCKTSNICCRFIDHTLRNRFLNTSGCGPQLRNASCIMLVCSASPLTIKQPVHLGDILHVLIWKTHIQVFQCRKILSESIKHFSTSIKFFGYLVTNLVPNVPFYVVEGLWYMVLNLLNFW